MSVVKKYRAEVISVLRLIADVYTIEFSSLSGKFKYHPGQYLHLSIDADYDGVGQWPESRCFSMQSNPDEEAIRITYAAKGNFTKLMESQIKTGSEVWLKLPYGDLFTQAHNKTKTVFIAGGTGITPFLSLFSHRSFREYLQPRIYLGFRSKEYNNYKSELDRMNNSSGIIRTFYNDSDGLIDINLIISENDSSSSFFISGPPDMIRTFKLALNSKGVPLDHILTDDWE
jgi:ferredoxin-NADP reductase